ncbi:MAG: hypothetical protein ACLTF5_06650 [Butyricicoccus sp.]
MWPAKEAKKKARQASECQASVPPREAAEQQTEQQAKAAAPRSARAETTEMIRATEAAATTRTPASREEPRVDAHTPSRAYALSDEAAARIRKRSRPHWPPVPQRRTARPLRSRRRRAGDTAAGLRRSPHSSRTRRHRARRPTTVIAAAAPLIITARAKIETNPNRIPRFPD